MERRLAGTPVVYSDDGAGPPVVLVHGLNGTADEWSRVADLLVAAGRRVVVPNLRGRAPSGPQGEGYDLSVDVGDLRALVAEVGPGVTLLGHSLGGLMVLLAASGLAGMGRLVLYDATLPVYRPERARALPGIAALLAAGDRDGALAAFLAGSNGMPAAEVDALRARPEWARLRELIPATYQQAVAVSRVARDGGLDLAPYRDFRVPTDVVVGERSGRFHAHADTIAAAIPGARRHVLPGQGHTAHRRAPEMLADILLD